MINLKDMTCIVVLDTDRLTDEILEKFKMAHPVLSILDWEPSIADRLLLRDRCMKFTYNLAAQHICEINLHKFVSINSQFFDLNVVIRNNNGNLDIRLT